MFFRLFYSYVTIVTLILSCKPTPEELFDKADALYNQAKYKEAIDVYTRVLKEKPGYQIARYNRALSYMNLKKYNKAYEDLTRLINVKQTGNIIFEVTPNPIGTEEGQNAVAYSDALYLRAQIKYYMDSLKSAYIDFEWLINNNYKKKTGCFIWQGNVWLRTTTPEKACASYEKAKLTAVSENEIADANRAVETYCNNK